VKVAYLTSSVNPSRVGQPITLTAHSTASTLTGTVNFYDGTKLVASRVAVANVASWQTAALKVGLHSLSVQVPGLARSALFTQRVDPASTTLTLAASSTTPRFGQPVTLRGVVHRVAPSTGSVTSGSVRFMEGSKVLGTQVVVAGTAAIAIRTLGVGVHSVRAQFLPSSSEYSSVSSIVGIAVSKGSSSTSLTVSSLSPVHGTPVTLSATVKPVAPSTLTPTGSVSFYRGLVLIGTTALSGGRTSLITTTLPKGALVIQAKYLGSTGYAGSSSTKITINVK
jgi:hypothetical protein